MVNKCLWIIQESKNGEILAIAKENLLKTRFILKGCLKKIDDIFGVEEL